MKKSKKTFLIYTFGCQMNHSDSERFSSILKKSGFTPTDDEKKANLIVFNTCSVRQKAEDRILGTGKKIKKLKENNKNLKVIVTGCMAKRSWSNNIKTGSPIQMTKNDRELELKKTMPWVDFVLETKEFNKLPHLLGEANLFSEKPESYLSYKPDYQSKFKAYIPISTGCDHFCTYCIVPFARGGEICRSEEEIYQEIHKLIQSKYKDITLLGQTVNRWINPKYDQQIKKGMIANTRIPNLNSKLLVNPSKDEAKDFLQLLQKIDSISGKWLMSFISSHPNYMTNELIDFIANSKHIRPYLHFALQSGSNEILKRMNRRHDIEEFVEKTKYIKKQIPNINLSTDVIVGFPGETESQFLETAKVMQKIGFDMAYISEFSPRKGTAAGLLKDDISKAEKTRRKKYLNDNILAISALKNNKLMLNSIEEVLIDFKIDNFIYKGKTSNYKDTRINSKTNLKIGEFVKVKITSVTPWALEAQTLGE